MNPSGDKIQAGVALLIRFGSVAVADEAHELGDVFDEGAHLQRSRWRGGSAFAVTQTPAMGSTAITERDLPATGTRRALAFGDFFGGQTELAAAASTGSTQRAYAPALLADVWATRSHHRQMASRQADSPRLP